jgi:hypothetical protein
MLHKLKPVPRALVILAIVGVAGYGLTMVDFSKLMPKKAAPVTAETVEAPPVTTVAPPAPSTPLETANTAVQAATQAAQPVQPAPAQAPSGLTPATPSDAGLANVLGSKK